MNLQGLLRIDRGATPYRISLTYRPRQLLITQTYRLICLIFSLFTLAQLLQASLLYHIHMKARVKKSGTLEESLLTMMDGTTRTAIRKLVKSGRVTVDGTPVMRAGIPVEKGQGIVIAPVLSKGAKRAGKPGKPIRDRKFPFNILFEDEYLIAVDKPPGLLCIATSKEKLKTLYRMVSDHVKNKSPEDRKIFIVHRLDRDVSGVIVFAKDQKTKRALQGSWADTGKIYHAVVDGKPRPAKGTVKNHLCENRARMVYVCHEHREGAAEAITHYRTIRSGQRSQLEIRIETGRKHQIRVHMATSLGCPITGDPLYGSGTAGGGIALHAHMLTFKHPHTGKRITVKSPMPGRFRGMV